MTIIIALVVVGLAAWKYASGSKGPLTISGYAQRAGFSGADLAIAVAIAYAESSGNPQAVGDNGDSIGLWQINLPNHPEYSDSDLTDPQTNANAAFDIYSNAGNSFSPWTTFRTGAYQQYYGDDSGVSADSELQVSSEGDY